jgi:hypothetical protein
MNRVAPLCFVVAFVFMPLAAHAQGRPGGPPPNLKQLVSQLATLTAQVTTLQGQVATLQGQVATLEGDIVASDLAGTYTLMGLETTMRALHPGPPTVNATIDTVAYRGVTLTLNADGTGNTGPAGACEGSTLTQGTWAMHGFDCGGPATGVTWTYADGVITITFLDDGDQLPFTVALGGRLLIVAFAPFHPSDPSSNQVLLIATRLK